MKRMTKKDLEEIKEWWHIGSNPKGKTLEMEHRQVIALVLEIEALWQERSWLLKQRSK